MTQPLHEPHRTDVGHEGGGWLTFATVMFLLAAVFNAVYGFSALANDDYFAADELLFGDLSMWGAIYLAFALAQLTAAILIMGRKTSGALLGIALALLHGTAVLLSIGAYPLWSVILLVVDGLILYGLSVYGLGESEA